MLAVVTNFPGWRVASPESDLEKAPDADWPLYPTTLPVLPVMFGNPADTDCPTSEVVFVPSMNL